MSRPRLHVHTDCAFFAGCESMLANLFADPALARDFELSFSYRATPEYEEGLARRIPSPPPSHPLRLWDVADLPGNAVFKLISYALLLKHVFLLRNVLVLWRLLRRLRPDVLHVNNGGWPGAYSCHSAAIAARLAGVPKVVYVVNNMAVPYRCWRRWPDWPFDRLAAACVGRFVTATRRAAAELERVLGLESGSTAVIPNGIAPRPVVEDAAACRRRLGVPDGAVAVAVVALLEERKGHRRLLEALRLLKDPPVVLIEGEGPEGEPLRAFAREAGLGERVRFLGREARVFDLLNAADVVAEVSIGGSPMPNIVTEAMSLGKAVLASRRSSDEQVADRRTGLLVDPLDPQALAAALSELVADPALRIRLGAAARAEFEARFTASAAVARYRELYRDLLERS